MTYSLPYFSRLSSTFVYPTIISCSFLLVNLYLYYNYGPQIVQLTISASEIFTNRKFYSIESNISSLLFFRITFFLNKNTPYPTPQSFIDRLPRTIFSYNLKLLLVMAIGVCWQSSVVPQVIFWPSRILILSIPLAPVRVTQVQSSEMEVRSGVGNESTCKIL